MPFSSVIGASSVIKPGVCTSTTRPTVPYEGQLIYETDTDRVAAYNGSAWDYTHSSGLVLISSTTIGSAVTSVTVSSAFSSTYDNYRVIVSGGVSSGNGNFLLTLGATSTGYYMAAILRQYTSGTVSGDQTANGSSIPYVGRGTTNSLNATFDVLAPNLAKNTHVLFSQSGAGTADYWISGGGYLADTTQYTAFTLTLHSGNMTGGTVKVYGYKN